MAPGRGGHGQEAPDGTQPGPTVTLGPDAPVSLVVARLEEAGCSPRRSGAGWSAKCPAHDDRKASLSVSEGTDGRAW